MVKKITIFLFIFVVLLPQPFLLGQEKLPSQPKMFIQEHPEEKISLEEKLSKIVDLDYKDADVLNVIRSLAWSNDLNVVIGQEVKGKVTLTLKAVPLRSALEAVLKISGLVYSIRDEVIYISKGDVEAIELVSEVVFLKYLSSAEAQTLITKTLSPKGDIQVNEPSNSLVITDFPSNIEKAKVLLKKVDMAPRQVIIEAKIVDVSLNDLAAYGIQWDIDYTPGKGLFKRNTSFPEEASATISLPEASEGLTGGQITLNGLSLKDLSVSATLDALVKNGKATILASPSIAVLNGQEARIVIGERYPYTERTQTTTGTTETVKFVDIGVTLRVIPQINDDGYITMSLHPEVSSLQSALDAGPRITTREADTMVRVKEGETLIIGGLIQHNEQISREKVPILGSIPFLGALFSRWDKSYEQKELAVFITPQILYSNEEKELLSKVEEKDKILLTTAAGVNLVERIFEQALALEEGKALSVKGKSIKEKRLQAARLYEHIYSNYPHNARAPEALYRAGMIYYKYKDTRNAGNIFDTLLSDYPETTFARKVMPLYEKLKLELGDIKGPRPLDLKTVEKLGQQ